MLGLKRELKIELALDHDAGGYYGVEERLFLRKNTGESMAHVAMKLASYLAFYAPGLAIEASANQHYKPDLVRFDAAGDPVQWIDCGQTRLKKLGRIIQRNPKVTFIRIVKRHLRELEMYAHLARARLDRPERVRFSTFDDGFVDDLAHALTGRHHLRALVTGGGERLYVDLDGRPLETAVITLSGAGDDG